MHEVSKNFFSVLVLEVWIILKSQIQSEVWFVDILNSFIIKCSNTYDGEVEHVTYPTIQYNTIRYR